MASLLRAEPLYGNVRKYKYRYDRFPSSLPLVLFKLRNALESQ